MQLNAPTQESYLPKLYWRRRDTQFPFEAGGKTKQNRTTSARLGMAGKKKKIRVLAFKSAENYMYEHKITRCRCSTTRSRRNVLEPPGGKKQ